MTSLEDLKPDAAVRGILPDALVTVVTVQWFGSEALELTYKTPAGGVRGLFDAMVYCVSSHGPQRFAGAI